jgi:hypothetical protein
VDAEAIRPPLDKRRSAVSGRSRAMAQETLTALALLAAILVIARLTK